MIKLLYDLIGEKIIHNNQQCVLIEVLEDGPHLVFQCESGKEIQCDQHGNAHRKSLPTYTIHCLNEGKTDLHPVLNSLLSEEQHKHLLEIIKDNQRQR